MVGQNRKTAGGGRSSLLGRYLRSKRASAAIEFGIVAAPFFALLFALIEIGLVFFAQFTLENAVDQAGRMIRTGQAQEEGFDQGAFKTEVCKHVHGLINCNAGLMVDVRKFDSFSSVKVPPALDSNGKLQKNFTYDDGDGGDIVVARALYEWDLIAKIPGIGLGNMSNGNRLLEAAAAFRNEPFGK